MRGYQDLFADDAVNLGQLLRQVCCSLRHYGRLWRRCERPAFAFDRSGNATLWATAGRSAPRVSP